MRRRPARPFAAAGATLAALALVAPGGPAAADAGRVVEVAVESFDGTPIDTHLALPAGVDGDVPVVLKAHGFGSTKEQVQDALHARLLDEGFAVLTWDARGFGQSGGEVNVDAPDLEGRDVSALLDWVAEQDGIALDAPGDPVAGMTGESYGGGIELVAEGYDGRLEALAPQIAWNSLPESLYPGEVVKLGWITALVGIGVPSSTVLGLTPDEQAGVQTGGLAPEIYETLVEGLATNRISEEGLDFFRPQSFGFFGDEQRVQAPTLLLQGLNDTLFPPDEALRTAATLRAQGTEAKVFAFCGGLGDGQETVHGACPPWYDQGGTVARADDQVVRWFARHLRGDDVDTGPDLEVVTNAGVWHVGDGPFPGPGVTTTTTDVVGDLAVAPVPTGGAAVVATPSPPGPGVLEVPVLAAADRDRQVVGTPRLRVDVTGAGAGEAFLFAKLVDLDAGNLSADSGEGHVLQLQEQPVRLDLPEAAPGGASTTLDLELVPTAYDLPAGHRLALQLTTASAQYTPPRGTWQLSLDGTVDVPVRERPADRLAGPDRVATAVQVSRDRASATTAVLARSDAYADALAGAPLAAQLGAPVLLTAPDTLDEEVRLELVRLGVTDLVLLGGEAALGPQVADAAAALGLGVDRVAGADRFATAAAVADRLEDPSSVLLVEGVDADPSRGWPDAVSAAGLAALTGDAVLLTSTEGLPAATSDALAALAPDEVVVVGGTTAVASTTEDDAGRAAGAPTRRVAGSDRYATSALLVDEARAAGADPTRLWLATGADWPDALAGGAAVAQRGAVLVLSPPDGPEQRAVVQALVDDLALERVVLVGGPTALEAGLEDRLAR